MYIVKLQLQVHELKAQVSSVESQKMEMEERIKIFDTDITSKKVSIIIFVLKTLHHSCNHILIQIETSFSYCFELRKSAFEIFKS